MPFRAGLLAALAAPAAAPSGVDGERRCSTSGVQWRDSDRMHLAMALLSLLLPWGADTNIDRICREGSA
jgi:hypothetical protein